MSAPGRRATDRRLGELWFPAGDEVIWPEIHKQGIWDPAAGLWLDRTVRPGMTVVDVGANVGYFALWAAQLVGATGTVIAVEPHPGNADLLRRNVAGLGAEQIVQVHQCAATARSGELDLYVNEVNGGDHRVFPPADAGAVDPELARASGGFDGVSVSITVPGVTVSELVGDRRVDVMFVDTQGHDHEVISGAHAVIERDRPVILVEFTPAWITAQGADPLAVLAQYRSLGYRIGVWDAGYPPGAWPDERIAEWAAVPGRWFTNLELWPEERSLPVRALPADGFWTVERGAEADWQWLTSPVGVITVSGPANAEVEVVVEVVPPPGSSSVRARVGGQSLKGRPGREHRHLVTLDGQGWASIDIEARDTPRQASGDPRPLYLAVRGTSASLVPDPTQDRQ